MFFTASVRRLGVPSLNFVRLWFALILLTLALIFWKGNPIPLNASSADWFWLAVSAVIGLVIGDLFTFGSFNTIGPRHTMLLFSLAPPVAALGELVVYGNGLSGIALSGMAVTLVGVSIVISERKKANTNSHFSITLRGLMLGMGAAFCQGLGLVFSKMGIETIDAMSGTFIRMLVAAPLFSIVFFASGRKIKPVLKQSWGLKMALGGAFFGPFLGVTLSLVAAKHTHAGIAMTILSTTPITVLPYVAVVYKERLTLRAVLGAGVAVTGVALLCI
jgi:drug/metabolite transporter (DMT)-like permease